MQGDFMYIYKFFETDISGYEEYDIAGEAYQRLIQLCFKHSASVSFLLSPLFSGDLSDLEPYRLPLTENVKRINSFSDSASDRGFRLVHYRLAPEVRHFLLNKVDSVFKWKMGWGYENPDNPCFFRSDDSVFFSSVIHEGECTLHPDPGEDISQVFQSGLWFQTVGYWEMDKKCRYFNDSSWAMYEGPGLMFVPGYPGYITLGNAVQKGLPGQKTD